MFGILRNDALNLKFEIILFEIKKKRIIFIYFLSKIEKISLSCI